MAKGIWRTAPPDDPIFTGRPVISSQPFTSKPKPPEPETQKQKKKQKTEGTEKNTLKAVRSPRSCVVAGNGGSPRPANLTP